MNGVVESCCTPGFEIYMHNGRKTLSQFCNFRADYETQQKPWRVTPLDPFPNMYVGLLLIRIEREMCCK